MAYVYLDWNVIQYMKYETKTDVIDGKAFYDLVKKLSNKYQFPFSEGHLRDLAISSASADVISQDLKFLSEVSNGFVLSIDQDETLIPKKHHVDITTFFNQIANEENNEPSFNIAFASPYQIDMHNLPKDDLLKPFLESNNGIFDPTVMQNFLVNMWRLRDDPDYYKSFRNSVAKLKERFNKTNTILDKGSEYYKKIIPFLEFFTMNDENVLKLNFDKTLRAFLAINERNINNMKIGEKIEIAYMLLDFHPLFKDKVNKKNRPSNISRDLKNFFFASQAKYYVTEDKATFKKASFVSEVLSLNVKVLKMEAFRNKFC